MLIKKPIVSIKSNEENFLLDNVHYFFFIAACEKLIRKMLVLDPSKRYTINMIKKHPWMQQDGGAPKQAPPSPVIGQNAKMGEYNEQILRLMQGMKIDRNKTVEVLNSFRFQ